MLLNRPLHILVNWGEVIISLIPALTKIYYTYHEKRVRAELNHINLGSDSHVLFVGGGPVPHSAIRMAREYGANVDVIDNWLLANTLAKSVVRFFREESKIKLIYGDGFTFPLASYQVIFVATHVMPKEAILHRLITEAPQGSLVVFRNPTLFLKLMDVFDPTTIPSVEVREIQEPSLRPFRSYIVNC